jgi:hypothetical protein
MKQPIEEYLERIKKYDYTEEQLEAVRQFRENAEHMSWEQYRFLIDQNLLFRTKKLKKKRNIYFHQDKLWVLNHYHKKYEYIGWIHSEEFLAERTKKEEEQRRIIEEARAEKKRLKQEAMDAKKVEIPTVVKPKRKRIVR